MWEKLNLPYLFRFLISIGSYEPNFTHTHSYSYAIELSFSNDGYLSMINLLANWLYTYLSLWITVVCIRINSELRVKYENDYTETEIMTQKFEGVHKRWVLYRVSSELDSYMFKTQKKCGQLVDRRSHTYPYNYCLLDTPLETSHSKFPITISCFSFVEYISSLLSIYNH